MTGTNPENRPFDTTALIAALAANHAPARKVAVIFAKAIGLGAVLALILTMAVLGPRRDVATAAASWQYWAKFAYPLALAGFAFLSLERLARPGVRLGARPWAILLPPIFVAVLAGLEWTNAEGAARAHLFYGHSWRLCPFLIVMVSTPAFIATIWAMRRLAPTRPVLAGAAAGLFAGALGAWIYAFHCNESALTFVGLWYTSGIAAVTLLGAATGRWLLRW